MKIRQSFFVLILLLIKAAAAFGQAPPQQKADATFEQNLYVEIFNNDGTPVFCTIYVKLSDGKIKNIVGNSDIGRKSFTVNNSLMTYEWHIIPVNSPKLQEQKVDFSQPPSECGCSYCLLQTVNTHSYKLILLTTQEANQKQKAGTKNVNNLTALVKGLTAM